MLNGTPPFAKLFPEDEKLYHSMRSSVPIRPACHTKAVLDGLRRPDRRTIRQADGPVCGDPAGRRPGRVCERDIRT